jgi:hypothetical protein
MQCPQGQNTAAIHPNDQVLLAFLCFVAKPRVMMHCSMCAVIKMHLNISAITIDMNDNLARIQRWS